VPLITSVRTSSASSRTASRDRIVSSPLSSEAAEELLVEPPALNGPAASTTFMTVTTCSSASKAREARARIAAARAACSLPSVGTRMRSYIERSCVKRRRATV